jgi:hypothetical protein
MEFDVNTMKATGTPEEIVKFMMLVEPPSPLGDRVNSDEDSQQYMDEHCENASTDVLAFDVVPHTLKSGPNKNMVGLKWPCGSFVHNDWNYRSHSRKKFLDEVYKLYGISKTKRLYYNYY